MLRYYFDYSKRYNRELFKGYEQNLKERGFKNITKKVFDFKGKEVKMKIFKKGEFYMKAIEIRNKYLEFFKKHGHAVIPSAPLIPENDPSVLFTTAGMQPLVPYLLGEKHPEGTRLTDYQKCVRTNDIDEVGDNRHLTYFEMLGNWSLGDYFKEESIAMNF